MVDGASGARCHGQDYVPGYDQHYWEFVTPVVGFPAGWFHIENANTGYLLSQTYLHHPPVLLPPPLPSPSQYAKGWQFQWSAYHPTFWSSDRNVLKNSWVIVNRLTRGVLINKTWEIEDISLGSVTAWQPVGGIWSDAIWKLELDSSHNWKIINTVTSFHLEQTQVQNGEGRELTCVDSKHTKKGGNKSWILRYICVYPVSRLINYLRNLNSPPMLQGDEEVNIYPLFSPKRTHSPHHAHLPS